MAGCVLTWILKLCVFTKIFVLITAQTGHMTNVAINKPCSISSLYVGTGSSNDCSAAINGNTNTTFVTEKTSQNCIHTSESDLHPFWSVDMGQNFSVHRITIYGRNLFERRMDCVQVWLDGRELYKFPCSGTTTVTTDIPVNPPQRGRVVRVTRETSQTSYKDLAPFLNFCEIQVWVCSIGWWGSDCQNMCSCQGEDYYCDPDHGTCSKVCSFRYWGENCTVCGAGCNNTCDAKSGACRCTNGWTGPRCTECSTGHWGDHCSHVCGRGCKNGACNVHSGTCECKSGWAAPNCDDCSDGYYNMSNDCQNTCGKGCHDTCRRTDGTCQCQTGWQPPLCQHCSDGHYNVSNDCQNTCGEGCHDTCNRTDGTCQCQTGWQPPLCQRKNTSAMMSSCDCKEALSGAGPVAGTAVGCAIVFFILGVLTGLKLRLSRSRQPSATHGSPVKTFVTCDLGTSSTMTHPTEPRGTTSEDTSDHSNNVYDELKARNDDNKSAYTSLRFQNKDKKSAAPSDYVNTRKILMNE